ncbi:MAG: hypothetical protein EUB_01826 [Eubacterium sp.]
MKGLVQLFQKDRRGFTLVELIVVLVILAILAAFTIPAMLGFVNDAKAKASVSIAREIYVAAQSASTEIAANMKLEDKEESGINRPEKVVDYLQKKIISLLSGDIDVEDVNVKVFTFDRPEEQTLTPDQGEPVVSIGTNGKVYSVQYVDNLYNLITIKDGETIISKSSKDK